MFTISDIKAAHSKVKSGADFPAYIQDLIALGVTSYNTFLVDGHTEFNGADGYTIQTPASGIVRHIATTADNDAFVSRLKAHQQGQSDYLTFCNEAAAYGVEKWVVVMQEMTCTYYDLGGNAMLEEKIPG